MSKIGFFVQIALLFLGFKLGDYFSPTGITGVLSSFVPWVICESGWRILRIEKRSGHLNLYFTTQYETFQKLLKPIVDLK